MRAQCDIITLNNKLKAPKYRARVLVYLKPENVPVVWTYDQLLNTLKHITLSARPGNKIVEYTLFFPWV